MIDNIDSNALPAELTSQIEKIVSSYRQLETVANSVSSTHSDNVVDSSEQLEDVLAHTERATNKIIENITAIDELVAEQGTPEAVTQKVNEHVISILEACSFQDISGQRIKKVLSYLANLSNEIEQLSAIVDPNGAVKKAATPEKVDKSDAESLKNGPQLSGQEMSQDAVDNLFD